MSIALDALILATGWSHVFLSPFTKVEESFNLHATHDVLMYGVVDLHNYDHFTFPGAVPRTFIGSVVLAWLSKPVIWLAGYLGLVQTKFEIQILVRLVLTSLNALTLWLIRRGVSRRFGRSAGLFFTLLTCSQFHLPFWMGRTIPNMFAMIPVNFSTYLLVDRTPNATRPSSASIDYAIACLTFTAAVFRAEVALLLGPLCLQLLASGQIPVRNLVEIGLFVGVLSVALTTAIDSYFWRSFPLWPEFSGILFNVVEGKSAEWGTSPSHTYVTAYLPKLLLGSLPLALVGFIADQRIRSLLIPSLTFIGLISSLGHKEWRFVIYVVPIFNVAAARGARWMVSRRKNSFFGRLLFLFSCSLIGCNFIFTMLSTKASMANYPGGKALLHFHHLVGLPNAKVLSSPPHLHISNLAAQTGASLFLQLNAPPTYSHSRSDVGTPPIISWRYNKTENLSTSDLSTTASAKSPTTFTHLISEISPTDDRTLSRHWRVLTAIKGFDRWAVNWELLRGRRKDELLRRWGDLLRFEESEKLWILERQN